MLKFYYTYIKKKKKSFILYFSYIYEFLKTFYRNGSLIAFYVSLESCIKTFIKWFINKCPKSIH